MLQPTPSQASWPTAKELAGLPGMPNTDRSVRRKALAESWPGKTESTRGGQVIRYNPATLPAETRLALSGQRATGVLEIANDGSMTMTVAAVSGAQQAKAASQQTRRMQGVAAGANLTGKRATTRDSKLRVLALFQEFWSHYGGALCPALQAFADAWKNTTTPIPSDLLEQFPTLAWTTLRNWWAVLKLSGTAALAPAQHHRKGKYSALEGEIGKTALALLSDMPHLSASQIYRLLSTQFSNLPTQRAFRRAIAHWKKTNQQTYVALQSPDKWRSQFGSAAGSRSAGVNAPNMLWEMDSTVGDVVLNDGKRHAILGLIDVYSRRTMWLVSRTSRSNAVLALLRRAMAQWGLPNTVKTDNGKDYASEQVKHALLALGVEQDFCAPFNPIEKPHIERVIGTLMHDLFELLPGFIGHSVAQRKDIEARRSFAERLTKKTGEAQEIELRLNAEELQNIINAWAERYHNHEHSSLGESPNQRVANSAHTIVKVDERALDVFLAPAAEGGLRTVAKKGLRIGGGNYNAAELGGLEGQQVQVKVDEANLGHCWVFDLDGRFIAEAIDHSALGVSAAEVAAERATRQRSILAAQKRELKVLQREIKPRDLVASVLAARTDAAIQASPNVLRLPTPIESYSNDAIESLLEHRTQQAPANISEREQAALALIESGKPIKAPVLQLDDSDSRYSQWLRLDARIERGQALSDTEHKWFAGYTDSSEWRAMQQLHGSHDPLAING